MEDSPLPDATSPPSGVRASDIEREGTTERLTAACAEGRLTLEELGVRVERAVAAVTRDELDRLVADLPVSSAHSVEPLAVASKRRRMVAVMSSAVRRGHWRIPARLTSVSVMAETELDLRHASLEAAVTELTLVVVMGSVKVIVPEGIDVEVNGMIVMGERNVEVPPMAPAPGGPQLRLKVAGVMGEVTVVSGRPEAPTERGLPGHGR